MWQVKKSKAEIIANAATWYMVYIQLETQEENAQKMDVAGLTQM